MGTLKKILVADDHSFVRLGIMQILADEFPSAELLQAADGGELVKLALQLDVDLIISDLEMPGKSGLEALQQIKLSKPQVPVIILSIYEEDLYAVRVLKSGASAYLNKNAAPFELIHAINRVMLGKKYISPEVAEKLLQQEEDRKPHEELSNREMEIFRLLASGRSISQIAEQLSLAPTTVSTHRSRILEKMGLKTNAELTRYALMHHFISDMGN